MLFHLGILWIELNEHFMCKSLVRHIFTFFLGKYLLCDEVSNYLAYLKICVAFLLVFELLSSFYFLDTSFK